MIERKDITPDHHTTGTGRGNRPFELFLGCGESWISPRRKHQRKRRRNDTSRRNHTARLCAGSPPGKWHYLKPSYRHCQWRTRARNRGPAHLEEATWAPYLAKIPSRGETTASASSRCADRRAAPIASPRPPPDDMPLVGPRVLRPGFRQLLHVPADEPVSLAGWPPVRSFGHPRSCD